MKILWHTSFTLHNKFVPQGDFEVRESRPRTLLPSWKYLNMSNYKPPTYWRREGETRRRWCEFCKVWMSDNKVVCIAVVLQSISFLPTLFISFILLLPLPPFLHNIFLLLSTTTCSFCIGHPPSSQLQGIEGHESGKKHKEAVQERLKVVRHIPVSPPPPHYHNIFFSWLPFSTGPVMHTHRCNLHVGLTVSCSSVMSVAFLRFSISRC